MPQSLEERNMSQVPQTEKEEVMLYFCYAENSDRFSIFQTNDTFPPRRIPLEPRYSADIIVEVVDSPDRRMLEPFETIIMNGKVVKDRLNAPGRTVEIAFHYELADPAQTHFEAVLHYIESVENEP